LTEKGRGSKSFGRQSTSFANKSSGKSLCSSKHTSNPTPTHNLHHKSPSHQSTKPTSSLRQHKMPNTKSPPADNLQLTPWPPQYRAAPPPKYYGDTDPSKYLMCYEADITSSCRDDDTLAKSLIISLKGATAKWYSRLPPRCIYSWHQLKEKFMLNFQGFQAELNIREDFLSCAHYEKETLPNFY
jgi:hypothetical protein